MRAFAVTLPVRNRCCVVRVGVAIVTEVRAGVVLTDVLGHNSAASQALAFILEICMGFV